MNRILFERSEITDGIAVCSDGRAEHIRKVLHGELGQSLKTGEIGGLIGTGEIVELGSEVKIRCCHDAEPLPSWCDLILAPPRPRVMKRLLPQLATLGVGRIVLVGAKKVEKDFWGATLLKEENYRPLLIDGLMQGGVATELPVIETRRNFRAFVRDELEMAFPTTRRIVAHPYGLDNQRLVAPADDAKCSRLLLAVGPEGGWTDQEVGLLEEHRFMRYSLGRRILRTDTALVALLSKLTEEI